MAGINHPVVSGQGLAGQALRAIMPVARGIASLGRTAAHAAASEVAITAVDTLAGAANQGIVSFDLDPSRDTQRVSNPSEMTNQELANSLRIEQRPAIGSMTPEQTQAFAERDADGTSVANELLLRLALSDAQSDTIFQVIETKAEMSGPDDNALAGLVPDTVLDALTSPEFSSAVQTDNLSSMNRQRVSSRTLDGRRVSREYGEFQYCRSSGQIGSALNFIQLWDNGQLDGITEEEAGEGYGAEEFTFSGASQDDISYGQFVDMVCFRKFIALRRNLLRKVRAANVTCVLRLVNPPVDPELLARRILAGADHRNVVEEINRTFNENVRINTNQEACVANGGATSAIEDRRQMMEEFGSGGQGQT